MSKVCHSVGVEPSLQPVTGEHFEHKTANRQDGTRLDIVAQSLEIDSVHFLMLGFLTRMHLAIKTPP